MSKAETKLFIAGDHKAVELMTAIASELKGRQVDFEDLGASNERTPLPLQEMIPPLVEKVKANSGALGILACGTGVGVEIGANRFSEIRASLCSTPKQAERSRIYDNTNVLCLSSWDVDGESVSGILDAWLGAEFDGDESRAKMLKAFDSWS